MISNPEVRFSLRLLRPALLLLLIAPLAACREQGTIQVKSIAFDGTKAFDAKRLKSVLATKESSRIPFGRKHYFDRKRIQNDLKRIEAFYRDHGYPDAHITALDVKMNDKQDQVRVKITIDEGKPYIVDAIRFQGFDALPAPHFKELQNRIPLKANQPRDRQYVQVSREMGVSELRDHGYPYAKVDVSDDPVSAGHTIVRFQATPGTQATYGPVAVQGNVSVGEDVIRRQVTYRPGQLFRQTQLQETQRNLYGMELFQFANVEGMNTETQPALIPTRITVAEAKHQQVTFGGGYGTEEKARGQIEYRHVNFLGGARSAGVKAKWSSLDRGVRLDFNEPHFFTRRYTLGGNGQYWFAREPAYSLDSLGGRLTVTRRFSRRGALARDRQNTNSISAALIQEREVYSIRNEALNDLTFRDQLIALGLDPRTGAGRGTLTALALDAQRNTTNNLLDARTGYAANVHFEQAGRWLPGTYNYFELTTEGRHYLPIGTRLVFANRIRFGSIDGGNTADVPFFKRYFLGGSTSLRGWGRFQVSPLSGSGLPIGGHATLEATSEIRLPISGNLGGVLFVDAGNVWTEPWRIHFGDLRYAVGPGLRYQTPIGPIRFDFGYQLTPIEGLLVNGKPETRHWRVHFSIGQAF